MFTPTVLMKSCFYAKCDFDEFTLFRIRFHHTNLSIFRWKQLPILYGYYIDTILCLLCTMRLKRMTLAHCTIVFFVSLVRFIFLNCKYHQIVITVTHYLLNQYVFNILFSTSGIKYIGILYYIIIKIYFAVYFLLRFVMSLIFNYY